MKKVILIVMLMVGTVSIAQEKTAKPFYETEEYKDLKKYYSELVKSGNYDKLDVVKKDFLDKLGRDNFNIIKNSGVSMSEWITNNLQKTQFKSLNEYTDLMKKWQEIEAEISVTHKKMTPLFQKITKEVGYSAFFKKINEDLLINL